MSKTKKSYNDKYNGRDDDDEEEVHVRSSHKEHRQNLRKERALRTKNIEEFAELEEEQEGDEDYIPFYDYDDDDTTAEDIKKYIVGSK